MHASASTHFLSSFASSRSPRFEHYPVARQRLDPAGRRRARALPHRAAPAGSRPRPRAARPRRSSRSAAAGPARRAPRRCRATGARPSRARGRAPSRLARARRAAGAHGPLRSCAASSAGSIVAIASSSPPAARHASIPPASTPPTLRHRDRVGERDRLARVGLVVADEQHLGVGRRQPREARAKAGVADRQRQRAADVPPSHAIAERTSTINAPASRRERSSLTDSVSTDTPSTSRGPLLISTMARKLGGCGCSPASTLAVKLSTSGSSSHALCSRSKPIVEDVLTSISAPPHSEPPRWAGHTSVSGASASSRSCRLAQIWRAPSVGSIARSGRATLPTNSESAGQHRPRLARAGAVAEHEGGVLGPMAGRVQGAYAHAAQARAPSRPRTARAGTSRPTRRASGSSRRLPPRGGRGPRRGRRGCGSPARARCARRSSRRGAGTRRSPSAGRRPPPRPRAGRRRGRRHSRGRRGGSGAGSRRCGPGA